MFKDDEQDIFVSAGFTSTFNILNNLNDVNDNVY